jgi:hypothetical protein
VFDAAARLVAVVRAAEGERASIVREAERAHQRALGEGEHRRAAASDEAARACSTRVAQVEEELASALRENEQRETARTEREHAEHAAELGAVEERFGDEIARAREAGKEAVWLAETVYDGAAPKVKLACEQASDRALAGVARVEAMAAAAAAWSERARARLGAPAGVPAQEIAADGVGSDGAVVDGAGLSGMDELAAHERAAAAAFEEGTRDTVVRAVRSGLIAAGVPVVGAAAGGATLAGMGVEAWRVAAGVGAGALVAAAGAALPLVRAARRAQARTHARVMAAAGAARRAGERAEREAAAARDQRLMELRGERDREVARARQERERAESVARGGLAEERGTLTRKNEEALRAIKEKYARQRAEVERLAGEHRASALARRDRAVREAAEAWDRTRRETDAVLDAERARAAGVWARAGAEACALRAWIDAATGMEQGRARRAGTVRIGTVRVEGGLGEFAPGGAVELPLTLDTPGRGSLVVEALGAEGREAGLSVVRGVMLALLAQLPAGRARFTIVDPVGLGQSFAGFMRLTDVAAEVVGARIWTEARQIEQKLTDLTEHMETVIQKYLRDEYATLEEYNAQAGEIAEPYRFLVLADVPEGLTEESARRLASIAESGPRCGVHVLALTSGAREDEAGVRVALDRLRQGAVVVRAVAEGLRLAEASLSDARVLIDEVPGEPEFGRVVTELGERARRASRVEVAFGGLLPGDGQWWSRSSAEELRVPLGRVGATRVRELVLGRGTSQHVLIAGKTGSGKSTLLHVLIAGAAAWYGPDEVEFYLVDFKKGVEFKAYADGAVPHVRAVAIESDREFGLSVLRRLDEELKRRGDVFRDAGAQGLGAYRRERPGSVMPRQLLIIDEFQEFFTEDDRVAQEAALLLDRLVRQGRAFGMHVLLGSQTLSGAYTLARSTMGQMAVRIALQCSETDSYLILSEDNGAARLLSRPGEAIYNDANGLVEGNSPFQTAWLPDAERDGVLARVGARAREGGRAEREPAIVFEGSAAAELGRAGAFRAALRAAGRVSAGGAGTHEAGPAGSVATAWVGEPVAIRPTTGMVLRRRSGSNLLVVGQQEELALGMLSGCVLGLGVQWRGAGWSAGAGSVPGERPRVVIVDGTPEDDALAGVLPGAARALGEIAAFHTWRTAGEAVASVGASLSEREDANATERAPMVLVLGGVHRLRALRRKEDDFSFGSLGGDEGAKAERADQTLRRIVRDGPGFGVFTVCWCDTASNLQRVLDRGTIGEFGARAVMQTSAQDSSMLIESGSAARLGLRRAIFFDEQRGEEEKFRPFEPPSAAVLEAVARVMRG